MSYILIADAGSTKTDWSLLSKEEPKNLTRIKTKGLNPALQTFTELRDIISSARSQLKPVHVSEIYFFGAGCVSNHQQNLVKMAFQDLWENTVMTIESDMVGAAKALFGDGSGIACILGTGSNTCLFENGKITKQIPSLGYILGDEGSGVSLGKSLLNNIFKQQLPYYLIDEFQNQYNLSVAELIRRVYRTPMASAYIASFSQFIQNHIQSPEIHQLVVNEFDSFFTKNILPYGNTVSTKIGFVGSIAYNYEKQLKESANKFDLQIERILKEPISSLEIYYSNK